MTDKPYAIFGIFNLALANLELPVQLSENASIRRITPKERTELSSRRLCDPELLAVADLVLELPFEEAGEPASKSRQPAQPGYEKLAESAQATYDLLDFAFSSFFRSEQPYPLRPLLGFAVFFFRGATFSPRRKGIILPTSEKDRPFLDRANLAAFKDHTRLFSPSAPDHIRIAVGRYLSARTSFREEAIIENTIALESLLGDSAVSNEGSIGYKISLRAAMLAAAAGEERQMLFQFLKEIYSLRSMLVHGGKVNRQKLDGLEKKHGASYLSWLSATVEKLILIAAALEEEYPGQYADKLILGESRR